MNYVNIFYIYMTIIIFEHFLYILKYTSDILFAKWKKHSKSSLNYGLISN